MIPETIIDEEGKEEETPPRAKEEADRGDETNAKEEGKVLEERPYQSRSHKKLETPTQGMVIREVSLQGKQRPTTAVARLSGPSSNEEDEQPRRGKTHTQPTQNFQNALAENPHTDMARLDPFERLYQQAKVKQPPVPKPAETAPKKAPAGPDRKKQLSQRRQH